jgi:hypothetical protein
VILPLIELPIEVPKFLQRLTTLTFTPDSPPPLPPVAFPQIKFKDVSIDLAFVHCGTLIGEKLQIKAV